MQDSIRTLRKSKVDRTRKEAHFDLSNKVNHVYNQIGRIDGNVKDKEDRLWHVLLDSQSTCNVIINKELLTNTKRCN